MTINEKEKDLVLVQRARNGDREAFQEIVEKYQSRAYVIAFQIVGSSADAEDVVQESFVKAYLSLQKFQGNSAFYTWLYRIVYNMALDIKRKISRLDQKSQEFNEEYVNISPQGSSNIASLVDTPEQRYLEGEALGVLQKVLDGLSDEHRVVLVLRELDGLSYDEIAKVTNVSRGTVMSRLFYAREAFRGGVSERFTEQAKVKRGSGKEVNRKGKNSSVLNET